MVTASAHTEAAQRPGRQVKREPHNLARYLARHAGPLPKQPTHGSPQLRAAHEQEAMKGAGTPLERKAMRELLTLWQAARGYFPGKEMPVPRFGGRRSYDEGAVGFAKDPQGESVPVGVQFGRGTTEMLARPENQYDRDTALQTVLHEWGHNFQNPRMYRSQARIDPAREGGAEGFSAAAAPGIARALGRRYVGAGGLSGSEYRPFVKRLLREKGVDYFTRGQFAA